MLVILSGVAVGLGLGLLDGGRPANLGRLELRHGWVFVLALLVQLFAALRLAPDPRVPLPLAGGSLWLSYLGVLAGIWLNRRLPGLLVIGLGVLLNVLATTPHGGLMPVTPEALQIAGRPVPATLPPLDARPYVSSKDIVLPREQVPLWPISDRFAIPRGWPLAGVFSPGDVLVALGIAWVLAHGSGIGTSSHRSPARVGLLTRLRPPRLTTRRSTH